MKNIYFPENAYINNSSYLKRNGNGNYLFNTVFSVFLILFSFNGVFAQTVSGTWSSANVTNLAATGYSDRGSGVIQLLNTTSNGCQGASVHQTTATYDPTTSDFSKFYHVYFGCPGKDFIGSDTKGDGMAFSFWKGAGANFTNGLVCGGGLGYMGAMPKMITIEFDTWSSQCNSNFDCNYGGGVAGAGNNDHDEIALHRDGNASDAGRITAVDAGNLEDGLEHIVGIFYNHTSHILSVTLDGNPKFSQDLTGSPYELGAYFGAGGLNQTWSGAKYGATDAATVSDGAFILPTNNVALGVASTTVPNQSICSGATATFDGGAGFSSYVWTANGTGTGQTTSGTAAGNYTVTVTNANGCSATATGVLTVNTLPSPTVANKSICTGDPAATFDAGTGYAAYAWSANGTGTLQTTTGTTAGNYTVQVTDAKGCKGSGTGVLTVNSLPTPTVAGKNICTGDPAATFDAGAGYTAYLWSANGTGTSQTTTGSAAGSYTVQVTDAKGCKGTATGTLTVNSLPSPSVANQTICSGSPAATFDAGAGYTAYLWSANGTGAAQTTSGTVAGNYTVQVTNAAGCKASATGVLTVQTKPTTSVSPATQTVCSSTGVLSGTNPTSGTGQWTLVSGTGTVTNPAQNNSGVTGLTIGTNIFKWTISNGVCTPSSSNDTIIMKSCPITADFTSSATSACSTNPTSATITFTDNSSSPGGITGYSWDFGAGASPATLTTKGPQTVTYSSPGLKTISLTVTGPGGTDTRTKTNYVTISSPPTTANAGPDQTGAALCGLNKTTLAANKPALNAGTGTWTITSGAGGSFSDPSSNISDFTGVSGTSYVLTWTISNAPCPSSSSNVNILFPKNPDPSLAGADQTGAGLCGLKQTKLKANKPVIGTGVWSVKTGAGGSFLTPSSDTSTFAGAAGTAYLLTWTISNAPCASSASDVNVIFQKNPDASIPGADQTGAGLCGLTVAKLSANKPTVGAGAWSVKSGLGGTFLTPGSDTSSFKGNPGTAYVLTWTISNAPCDASAKDVNITFQKNPDTSIPGADQTGAGLCGLTQTKLNANKPATGTGAWTIKSGTGGSFLTANSDSSTFNGIGGNAYVLTWTISNPPCAASSKDVTILFPRNSPPANAGADQTGAALCGLTQTKLAAIKPTYGTGNWSVKSGSGGVFLTPGSDSSTFTGAGGSAYILTWSVTNAPCPSAAKDVNITFPANPTNSIAGNNQDICRSTATLAANKPSVGTGTWTLVSGTGTVTTSTAFNSAVTGLSVGSNVFRWTISNASCQPSKSDVTIKVDSASVGGTIAKDATVCQNSQGQIILSGQVGSIVRWESSTDDFVTPIPIANTTTSQGYANLNITTKYRAFVKSGSCANAVSNTVVLSIKDNPDFKLKTDTLICEGTEYKLMAANGYTNFIWEDGATGQTHLIRRPGTYKVTALDPFGCKVSAISNITGCGDSLFNVITPNGDGKNDIFIIRGLVPNSELSIYNRWGTLIYNNKNYDNSWDGGSSSDGTYFLIYTKNNTKPKAGIVEVIR